jgi:hypothetical protein
MQNFCMGLFRLRVNLGHCGDVRCTTAFSPRTDICRLAWNVRFVPEAAVSIIATLKRRDFITLLGDAAAFHGSAAGCASVSITSHSANQSSPPDRV